MSLHQPQQPAGAPAEFSMPEVSRNRIFSGLTFATSNPHKVREYEQISGESLDWVAIKLEEVEVGERHLLKMADRQYLEVVAELTAKKARQAFDAAGFPVVVESTALFIDRLDGWPGPLIGDLDSENALAVITRMSDRARNTVGSGATAVVTLAVFTEAPDLPRIQLRHGIAAGRIAGAPHGNQGWGWDSIFRPSLFGTDLDSLTYAEFAPEHKNMVSMRAQAVQALRVKPFIVAP